MKSNKTKKLPPIFKMSMLWNILPYYGYLHRWRRLLEKINSKTKDIWENYKEQLIYVGKDYKKEIELGKLKKSITLLNSKRNWFELFSLSLADNYYRYFDFSTLTKIIYEDEVLIIEPHDNINKAFNIYLWKKDIISNNILAINCPLFKFEYKIYEYNEMSEINYFIYDKAITKLLQ